MKFKHLAHLICGILLHLNVSAHSSNDSLRVPNRYTIYLNPMKLFGDNIRLQNYWLVGGGRVRLKENILLDVSLGGICYSAPPDPGLGILRMDVTSSTGFRVGAEPVYFLNKRIYFSVACSYERMRSNVDSSYGNRPGVVIREVFALTPKVGVKTWGKSRVYWDFSMGFGVRIISATNTAGIGEIDDYVEYEIPYNKPFAFGTKAFPNLLLDIKFCVPLGR